MPSMFDTTNEIVSLLRPRERQLQTEVVEFHPDIPSKLQARVYWSVANVTKQACRDSFADDYRFEVEFPVAPNTVILDSNPRLTNYQNKFSDSLIITYRVASVVLINNASGEVAQRIMGYVIKAVRDYILDNAEICDQYNNKLEIYTVGGSGGSRRSFRIQEAAPSPNVPLESRALTLIRAHMYRELSVDINGSSGRRYLLKYINISENPDERDKVHFTISVEVSQRYGPYPHGSSRWILNDEISASTTNFTIRYAPTSFFRPIQEKLLTKIEEQENTYKTIPVQIFKRRVLR